VAEQHTIPAVALLWLALPALIIFVLSRVSGWRTLSDHYPGEGERPRPLKRLGYGVFRGWIGYNGGIVVSADEKGLYLRGMPVLLSLCHAPIFIPWSQVSAIRERGGYLARGYEIRTRRAPEVDFALLPGTFEVIREHARAAGVAGEY